MPPKKKAEKKEEKEESPEMVEWYKKIPSKFLNSSFNPNFEQHHLNLPFRILITGSSGSGKTQTFLSLMRAFSGSFEKIIIIARMASEPIFSWLNEEYKDKGIEVIEGTLSKLPDLNSMDKTVQTCLLLDDQITSSAKEMKVLSEWFIRARKFNVSLIFITQIYHEVPRIMRLQMTTVICKALGSRRDLAAIIREYSGDYSKEDMEYFYKLCTAEKKNFMMIDAESFDPKYKIRYNFTPIQDHIACLSGKAACPEGDAKL